jgi:hypothetical protein
MNARILAISALVFLVGVGGLLYTLSASLVPAPDAAAGQTASQTTRSDSQSGITIKAVYATAAYFKANPNDALAGKVDPERHILFVINVDTHSGDLSGYDFAKNAMLRNDRGQRVAPQRWLATADEAHHRAGVLIFPRIDQAGRTIETEAKTLELVVRGLGGVAERTLRWSLPLQ